MKRFASYMAIVVAFCLCVSNRVFADELTVADGTSTNNYVPITASYTDVVGTRVQTIYPASLLSAIEGMSITALKFPTQKASIDWGTPSFVVKLAMVDATTLTGFLSADFTTVYSGVLSISSNALNIVFSENYVYSDATKSLLVEIEVTKSSGYGFPYFYGLTAANAAYGNKVSYGGAGSSNFRPKMIITYESATPVSCPKPKSLNAVATSASEASVSWQKNGSETAWNLQYSSNGGTSWTTLNLNTSNVAVSGDNCSYTLTGLSAQTTYQVKVQADCSGGDESSFTSAVSFATPCGKTSLPWTEGFESYAVGSYSNPGLSECWNVLNNVTSYSYYYPQVYVNNNSSYVKTGSKSLYFVSSSSKYLYVVLPEFEATIDALKISFSYKMEGASSGTLSVGYMTDPSNASTYHEVKSCSNSTSWKTVTEQVFSSIPSADIPTARITFRHKGTSDNWYMGIDDITVALSMDCGKPATPTCSNLTGTSATLSWTANTSVTEYKYLYIDRTANPSAMPDWTSATTITATTVNLTGLTDGHTYDFYVKCACGDVASDACTFTPLSCPNVTGVSLSNKLYNGVTVNWTTSATANCDIRYKSSVDADWTTVATNVSATSQAITGLTTGSTYTIEVKPTCSADGWVAANETFTPVYTAPATVNVSSITETTASASWTAVSDAASYEYIIVGRGASEDWTSPTAAASASASLTDMTLATDYDMYVRAVYANGGKSAGTKKEFSTIVNAPTVTLGSYNSESATCTWTAGGGATQYEWLCQTSTPTAANWLTANSTAELTATATALSANTQYRFYVRATANGKYSAVAQSAAFTTPCGTEDLPFSESFATTSFPACWSKYNAGSYGWTVYTYTDEMGSYCMRYNTRQTSGANEYIATPPVYISDQASLTFNMKASTAKTFKILISKDNGSTKTEVASYTSAATLKTKQTIDISSYRGETIIVYFQCTSTGSASYLYLDDVSITPNTCTTPTLNTPTVSYNSATITWTDTRAEQWSVRYRTYNTGDWTVVNDLTEKTYTMTGLTSGTEYEVQVRNDCATASSSWTTSKRFTPECKTG